MITNSPALQGLFRPFVMQLDFMLSSFELNTSASASASDLMKCMLYKLYEHFELRNVAVCMYDGMKLNPYIIHY